jgi:hypothetical protein
MGEAGGGAAAMRNAGSAKEQTAMCKGFMTSEPLLNYRTQNFPSP